MVDKYEAKAYIAQRIGQEYIIPTLGIWDRFEDIDFEALPDQFVLKCTHDSGGLVIVRDPNAEIMPAKPKQFEQMRKIAEQLSEGIPHLRVDFYLINERIYIGELTFFHMSGFTQIKPAEWNEKMGSWITLPTR